jgi:phosphoserine phosphatase RsbU/P
VQICAGGLACRHAAGCTIHSTERIGAALTFPAVRRRAPTFLYAVVPFPHIAAVRLRTTARMLRDDSARKFQAYEGRGVAARLLNSPDMRVVIADDDRVASEILARTLRRWEFTPTVTSNGAEAWEQLRAAAGPTLAILDWMMPELDGPEVCRKVRRELPLANMYLILVTAREGRGDIVAGLDAGADDYVIKPFDAEELRARIAVGVRVLTLQERVAERVAELQAALSNVKQLRGLLPICSYCKRIRGDDQYWQQVEGYIAEHSHAQFSHGICPTCFVAVSAELDEVAAQRAQASGARGVAEGAKRASRT